MNGVERDPDFVWYVCGKRERKGVWLWDRQPGGQAKGSAKGKWLVKNQKQDTERQLPMGQAVVQDVPDPRPASRWLRANPPLTLSNRTRMHIFVCVRGTMWFVRGTPSLDPRLGGGQPLVRQLFGTGR